ncbi:inositol 1,4,5-trisphosphate receptor-interacting protein-like 2 [Centroberyx affinis]|uniref:inositol 1,4,5-trisphosphate receptor-interacting protein-like 2 n=1 Tax=Centroberyx affinis TaxID=166261 RepID=UPI003A5C4571
MSVYTLNLRVFWPLFTCMLTGLVVLHHIGHRLSPEPSPDLGHQLDGCSHPGPPVLLSLTKLLLAIALCFLFIRYCSTHPGRARKGAAGPTDVLPKSSASRRELLEEYYNQWVRLSPHVVGHSKANVAKLIGDLVRVGRADVTPESSLAFRGDFLQVGSSYEEHKVGSPDCFDILVPLRLPRGLRVDPRFIWGQEMAEGEQKDTRQTEEVKQTFCKVRRTQSKRHKNRQGKEEKKEDNRVKEKDVAKEEGVTSRKEEDGKKQEPEWGPVPRCSLEVPPHEEWLHKHRAFTDTFLRLHPPPSLGRSLQGSVGGAKAYRLSPQSVLRWFYPAVQRCLATVRYPYEQRCTLSLTLSNQRLQLRLTPRSDYICCHISMVIRLLPALPLGDGLYLVPMDTIAISDTSTKMKVLEDKDLWRLHFPRHEQRLLGWLRARVPQGSCHLKVLQLVKAIRDLGAQALDSQGAMLWRSVLSSYVLKTAWLQLLLSTPPEVWKESYLVARVEDLMRNLRELLQKRAVAHLFFGGETSTRLLPDSVVLPKLVKEATAGDHGGLGGNLWAGIPPASLDLVSGRLAYAWTHLHRLIRLSRPQRSNGLGRAGHQHCQHQDMD